MDGKISTGVVIVGGGPTALAAALACQNAGLGAAIADTSKSASAAASKGRSAALFNKTVAFLQKLGVWDACAPFAEPLRALQFIDDTGRGLRAPDIAFHASEIGEEAFGYNIANADITAVLARAAHERGIDVRSPGRLAGFEAGPSEARVSFEDGTALSAPLVIAADGRASATREAAGIRSMTWSYSQIAMGTAFSHERPHNDMCIEFHRNSGPLTLVPLPGNRSSVVWSERPDEARRILALDNAAFCEALEQVAHSALGRISDPAERASFPLAFVLVREYGRSRVALAGEAAHAAPPIGAQGLNLGFRDVETLMKHVSEAKARGEDIGSDRLLRDYSLARRGDIVSRTLSLDLLNRSLLSGFLPFQAARSLGLFALGTAGPLRRAFMRRGIAPADLF